MFSKVLLLSILSLALLFPSFAQAQVVYVQPAAPVIPGPVVSSYYTPPVVTTAPPISSYYAAPATYSYYPPATVYTPPVTYSYYPPVTTYAAPTVVYPAGSYTTRTYQGFGIFRPRGTYVESYYRPYVYVR